MMIRITGELEEVNNMADLLSTLRGTPNVRSVEVSKPYANRKPDEKYRVYIDIRLQDASSSVGVALTAEGQ